MNLGGVFKNPVVWGGGALLGVVILMRSSPANANVSANMDAVNPTVMSANVQMNAAAYGFEIEKAKVAAELGAAKFNADVKDHALFYDFLKNSDNNSTVLGQARIESNAGITNSLISSSTAIIVDQMNNANRLALGYQQVNIAEINASRDVDIARYSYKAQKAVSKNNLLGTIAGTIGHIATAAIAA